MYLIGYKDGGKVIFLDVGGVLVSEEELGARQDAGAAIQGLGMEGGIPDTKGTKLAIFLYYS